MAYASESPSILNFMASSPDYGKIGKTSAIENMKYAASMLNSNKDMHVAGMGKEAAIQGAKYDAKGIRASGAADGAAAAWQGFGAGASAIVGGVGRRMAKGANSYGGTGSTEIDAPGKYGSFDPGSVQRDLDRINFGKGSGTMYSGFPNTNLG